MIRTWCRMLGWFPRLRLGESAGRVGVNCGGPGNPLSDEELARKFHDNAVRSSRRSARPRSRPERSPS